MLALLLLGRCSIFWKNSCRFATATSSVRVSVRQYGQYNVLWDARCFMLLDYLIVFVFGEIFVLLSSFRRFRFVLVSIFNAALSCDRRRKNTLIVPIGE
jgi:hypothetical protein